MNEQPIIIFGEVLWDCFPDGTKILGGAPFNVAWHLQAFGRSPLFISRVGKDEAGEAILEAMTAWGMNTEGVQIDPKIETGIVSVSLENGQPQYEIEAPRAYDFIEDNQLPKLNDHFLLYHGTLAARNPVSRGSLDYLYKAATTRFFDVNFRDPWWTKSTVKSLLHNVHWLKLNEEELTRLIPEGDHEATKIKKLFTDYPLTQILLTQGEKGAILFDASGDRRRIQPEKVIKVVDTVGAGDAFCSILLLGITSGWSLQTTLERAQTFASAIVGIQGATPNKKAFYQPFLSQWQ